jgi:hypothetical protein
MRDPFPLQWPPGWQRTPPEERRGSRFFHGFSAALSSLREELRMLGAANVIITSDLPVRRDGLPYAEGRRGTDPGIAVWFVHEGSERVIACDRYASIADNLRAIALSINALRGLARWGASDMVSRAFQGFNALPPGQSERPNWRHVMGFAPHIPNGASADQRRDILDAVRAQYRTLIKVAHTDVGGDKERAVELNLAMEEAERELGGAVAPARELGGDGAV